MTTVATPREVWPEGDEWLSALDRVGAAVFGGVVTGLFVGGVGARLAMFILRLTSDPSVRGLETDDGFTIGVISDESLFLLAVSTALGTLLALGYLLVRRWLPERARPLQGAVFFGALGGATIIKPDGLDFTVLDPLALAVALFVLVPALYGAAMVALVDWLAAQPGRWRPARVAALVIVAVLVGFGLVAAILLVVGVVCWLASRELPVIARGAESAVATWAVRVVLLAAAAFCAVDTIKDAAEIL